MSSPFLRSSIWKDFFLLLFNGKGKPRYMRFLEMNMMSRIDVSIWIKNLKKKYNVNLDLIKDWYNDSKLIQWLEIDTMTRNWYNDSKLLQWLEIATMTRNCYNNSKLIQWLKVDRPTMTRNWYNDTKTCHVMALIQFGFDEIDWYNDSKLIQWLEIDTMTQSW